MFKLTYLIRRRQDLDEKSFCRRWRHLHAELVERHSKTLRARRYAMSQRARLGCEAAFQNARRLFPAKYDGVIEIWWDSIEDYQHGTGSSDGLLALGDLVDAERKFIDFENSHALFTNETVCFGESGGRCG